MAQQKIAQCGPRREKKMSRNQGRPQENTEEAVFAPSVLSEFIALFQKHSPKTELKNPVKIMRRWFLRAQKMSQKDQEFFLRDRVSGHSLFSYNDFGFVADDQRKIVCGVVDVRLAVEPWTTTRPQSGASKKSEVGVIPETIAPNPEVDLGKVIFTDHALGRLREHAKNLFKIEIPDPLLAARLILSHATEKDAIDPVIRVRRIIKHDFEYTRYFVSGKWRLVVAEKSDTLAVRTIEPRKKFYKGVPH